MLAIADGNIAGTAMSIFHVSDAFGFLTDQAE